MTCGSTACHRMPWSAVPIRFPCAEGRLHNPAAAPRRTLRTIAAASLQQHRPKPASRWHPASRRQGVAERNLLVSLPSPVDHATEPFRSRPIRSLIEAFLPWNWLRWLFAAIYLRLHPPQRPSPGSSCSIPGLLARRFFSSHPRFLFAAAADHPGARNSLSCSKPPHGRAIR